ncbi:MAG: glucosamine-6-phosphate deaminase [Cyclobacteriaceae bacterium]|nr:glucosamine-6-phosphate deaminase [Cyclobacteriaceae bacterium]
MQLKIFSGYEALCKETCALIIDYIDKKPHALICFASGHTPVGVFKELHRAQQNGETDLTHCTFISLDEWVGIEPNNPGACLAMLQRDCFTPLQINPEQIQYFNPNAADLESECTRINQLIESFNGIDIMLVGVGTNGHIGMNEPGTPFTSVAHVAELAEETIQVGQKYFNSPTQLRLGITLGLSHLQKATLPLILASGKHKAPIIAKALATTATESIPVSIVHLIPQAHLLIDKDAASLLPDSINAQ